ncbi:uncharacterized protein METZ01_LOCUS485472 [marine metagenome]|uniref:Uncharacterized protein n=1 Tax=marine metagenome TaxID=408172 RepID=A0A383CLW2_9ZZZZ
MIQYAKIKLKTICPIIEKTHPFVYCIKALLQWPRFNFGPVCH